MKKTSDGLKKGLLDINESLTAALSGLRERQDIDDSRFDDWHRTCGIVRQQIEEELVRVAVIGPIKSGKSTFVNSLFGGDYLKRGAGIITSIITRIRSGKKLKAILFFKSWNEVNTDIEQALDLLPTWEKRADEEVFDIRKENDRHSLVQAMDSLGDDTLIADGTRDATTVLLSLYLKGYDSVSTIISGDSTTAKLSGKRFAEHRSYVGEDALAVYLKDIELEISGGSIDRSVEIADCQGSDSPNPLHLAMIQDYLIRTHFIVYVISSRTGLRQADIRFLLMIKKMRMLQHMLFVVNVDISEHDSAFSDTAGSRDLYLVSAV
jgi:GTPase SAR1 family protein